MIKNLALLVFLAISCSGQILCQVANWTSPGQLNGFGYNIAVVGDVNNDGVPDVLVGSRADAAELLSGADGSLIRRHDTLPFPHFQPWSPGFGLVVASVGDVNQDGVGDYAIGAPAHSGQGNFLVGAGCYAVYSGMDGSFITGSRFSDWYSGFGNVIKGISDLNGDGIPDIIVNAPTFSGNANRGWIGAFRGHDATPIWSRTGVGRSDNYGIQFDRLRGDMNADGVEDIAVLAAGRVEILSGADGTTIHTYQLRDARDVAGLGDIDGDGYPDFALSYYDPLVSGVGLYATYSGATGQLIYSSRTWGPSAWHGFGGTIHVMADIDGDGILEVAIGSRTQYQHTSNAGYIRIQSGANGRVLKSYIEPTYGGYFGFALASGDLNGDGVPEIISSVRPGGVGTVKVYATTPPDAAYWNDGAPGCPGTYNIPALNAVSGSRPVIGTTFSASVRNVRRNALIAWMLGLARSPIDLAPFGAQGCSIYPDTLLTLVDFAQQLSGNTGISTWAFAIPNTPILLGVPFYQQACAEDSSANPLGIVCSNEGLGQFGI